MSLIYDNDDAPGRLPTKQERISVCAFDGAVTVCCACGRDIFRNELVYKRDGYSYCCHPCASSSSRIVLMTRTVRFLVKPGHDRSIPIGESCLDAIEVTAGVIALDLAIRNACKASWYIEGNSRSAIHEVFKP